MSATPSPREPAPAGLPAAIEVDHLVAAYGDKTVLQDVSLRVAAGEVMVIMGGSGSGKSTLLRHLLGLERPVSGSVRVLGVDIVKAPRRAMQEMRRRIGVAFQTGALFSSMSVGENIMLPLREHARLDLETMRIMMRLKLDFVDLAGSEDLMPAELSGGMIKRAAVARAIIMDPKLIFLDEPSAGLDPVVAAGLDELILQLRASGASLVVVTHELESAFKIADRITVLDHGRILVSDTVERVKASTNERVQALLTRKVEHVRHTPEEFLRTLTRS